MTEPYVHGIYSSTTNTWQYVIADPETKYCAIIDPTRDVSKEEVNISTDAADQILALIKRRGYFVQCIMETRASQAAVRSAAWYLRMRLLDWQSHAPELFSRGAMVDMMARLFDRRYGARAGFSSTIKRPLEDGEVMVVGRMQVKCLLIPGSNLAGHCAFLVGNFLFGAYSIVQKCRGLAWTSQRSGWSGATDQDLIVNEYVVASLRRAFVGQGNVRVYLDEGPMPSGKAEPFEEVRQLESSSVRYFGTRALDFERASEGLRQST